MGLIVNVYRSGSGDCTNGGVSSKFSRLCVVNVEGPFEPDAETPAVRLERHVPGCLRIVPANLEGWKMFGGNYAGTCDSRFSKACQEFLGHGFYGAVAIHDRVEG